MSADPPAGCRHSTKPDLRRPRTRERSFCKPGGDKPHSHEACPNRRETSFGSNEATNTPAAGAIAKVNGQVDAKAGHRSPGPAMWIAIAPPISVDMVKAVSAANAS